MNVKLSFGSDHAGFEVKEKLISMLSEKFHLFNRGTTSKEQVDYPDYALRVVEDLISNYADFGVLICGTGIGISIMANRFPEIRACNPTSVKQVLLARQHNNANVICFGARLSTLEEITQMLDVFIETKFEGGRHEERIKKLSLPNQNMIDKFTEKL